VLFSAGARVTALPLPLVLATRNVDKAREIIEILVDHSGLPLVAYAVDVNDATIGFLLESPEAVAASASALPTLDVAPDVEETGTTLEENARIKASALTSALGLAAIADDTGLEVDAIDGAPGVYAARYAGPDATYADNVAKLLRELEGVYPALRTARFATVAVTRWPDGTEVAVRGEVEGVIAAAPLGENGFGYDPVFVPTEGDGRTFAQMTAAEKHAVSHRGRAFTALAAALTEPTR
jgi:XTP/dITP diphosphohydrolase